jgi:hypothetical protein
MLSLGPLSDVVSHASISLICNDFSGSPTAALPRANELLSQRWASKDAAGAMMMQRPADHDEVRFAPLIGANQSLSCQLLVVGGGLFGLSAAQAAVLRDIDVGRVWTKGRLGCEWTSSCPAG